MSRTYISILLILSVGCKNGFTQIQFKEVYKDVFESTSVMALQKDNLVILTELDTFSSVQKEFFYRSIVVSDDTMKLRSFISLYGQVGNDSLQKLRQVRYFINSFNKSSYSYDKIPEDINGLAHLESKKVIAFKDAKNGWFFLTSEKGSTKRELNFKPKNSENIISKPLPFNLSIPNFVLFDIIGDDTPEVFIFTSVFFMGKDLIELSIYKLEEIVKNKPA